MNDLVWHHATVTRERREQQNGHKSCVLWFTGLSGAGKSTLAHAVEEALYQRGCRTFVLDGDNVRHGLSSNLGFCEDDRRENIRRIGEAAKLMMEAGIITLTAFISPFRSDRDAVRKFMHHGDFLEIYCNASLDIRVHQFRQPLVQHSFCNFVACWFCGALPAAARPRQAISAGDFFGAFLPQPTKESTTWQCV